MMARKVMAGASGALDPILDPSNADLLWFYDMESVSGSTLLDSSPLANDATLNGSPSFVAGARGDVLRMTGHPMEFYTPVAFDGSDFAFSGKLIFAVGSPSLQYILSDFSSGGAGSSSRVSGLLIIDSGIIQFTTGNGTLTGDATFPCAVTRGVECLFAYDIDASTGVFRFWLDGVEQTLQSSTGSYPFTLPSGSNNIWFGGPQFSNTTRNFVGDADNLRAFTGILFTQDEIDALEAE